MGLLKSLKEYKLRYIRQARYIPILDKDPEFAAHSMTMEDTKAAFKLLKETFGEIKRGEIDHVILADTIMLSSVNFMWYVTFLRELEKMFEVERKFSIPFDKCPEAENKGRFEIYQPFKASLGDYRVFLTEESTNSPSQTPINNYRISYISKSYELTEFFDGCFPAWYLLRNTTIFESYNDKTNTRVRVDFKNGEFVYFISGASDNWQHIPDVPMEMDHVVSALLFRSSRS